jgi:acyl carrier protein
MTDYRSSDLETRVCKIISDDLCFADLNVNDDLVQDFGADQLDMLGLAMRLEEEFGLSEKSIREETLILESTVRKCVELVTNCMRRTRDTDCQPLRHGEL